MAVGDGIVGVICSETIFGDSVFGGAGWICAELLSTAKGLWTCGVGAFGAAPGGIGGFWPDDEATGDWLSAPEGPEKEIFLGWEKKGALDFRKPGRERRLDEARSGPGGGAELPRKEKLPPELMDDARRLYS